MSEKSKKWHNEIGFSEESIEKIRQGNSGKIMSQENRDKIGKANKGKIRSVETKNQISKTLKMYYETHPFPMKGRKMTETSKQKMKDAWIRRRVKKSSHMKGGT